MTRLYGYTLSLVLVGLSMGCSAPAPKELVRYELSGGIAGHATLVVVSRDGMVEVRDRAATGEFSLSEDGLSVVLDLCAEISDSGLGIDSAEPVECCDQILERISHQDKVYEVDEFDEALAERVRSEFKALLLKGLKPGSADAVNIDSAGAEQ